MLGKMGGHKADLHRCNEQRKESRTQHRQALIIRQGIERAAVFKAILAKQIEGAKARQAKFRTGLGGAWDWVRGETKRINAENQVEVEKTLERDKQKKRP